MTVTVTRAARFKAVDLHVVVDVGGTFAMLVLASSTGEAVPTESKDVVTSRISGAIGPIGCALLGGKIRADRGNTGVVSSAGTFVGRLLLMVLLLMLTSSVRASAAVGVFTAFSECSLLSAGRYK